MKQIQISGKKRETTGKKASKELRKEGMIPCNLYGEAKADGKPVAFSFVAPMSELRKLIYTPHIYLVEYRRCKPRSNHEGNPVPPNN